MKSSNLVSADTAWRNAWHDDLGDALLSLLSHGDASSLFSSPAFSWRGRAAGYTLHVIVLLLRSGRLDDVEAGLVFVLSISAVIFAESFSWPQPRSYQQSSFFFSVESCIIDRCGGTAVCCNRVNAVGVCANSPDSWLRVKNCAEHSDESNSICDKIPSGSHFISAELI